jgi:hypothetical protein
MAHKFSKHSTPLLVDEQASRLNNSAASRIQEETQTAHREELKTVIMALQLFHIKHLNTDLVQHINKFITPSKEQMRLWREEHKGRFVIPLLPLLPQYIRSLHHCAFKPWEFDLPHFNVVMECWNSQQDKEAGDFGEGEFDYIHECAFLFTQEGRGDAWDYYRQLVNIARQSPLAKCVCFMDFSDPTTGYPVSEWWA